MMTLSNNTASTVPDITTRAMLVSLSISVWTGRRTEKRTSQETAANHHADPAMLTGSKYLIAKEAFTEITACTSAARADHALLSLPWQASGANILSSGTYFKYAELMRAHETVFWYAVRKFESEYPSRVQRAEISLGSLYNPADYPTNIRSKFAFSFNVLPMPSADDFRVDLGNAELVRIKADIERSVQEATKQAMATVWDRVKATVGAMQERMKTYTGTRSGFFKDTIVSNVAELVDLLPLLNVTRDPQLTAVAEQMKRDLLRFDADELRASEPARQTTAQAAQAILDAVSAYI